MDPATSVRFLAVLAWLVFFGLIFVGVARASRRQPIRGLTTGVIGLGILALLLTLLSYGLVTIEPLERGVVTSYATFINPKGYRDAPLQPGINWIIPGFEKVDKYRISRQTYTMSIAPLEGQIQGDDSVTARTADGQEIYVDASVFYEIDPEQVIQLHIKWQGRYTDELVRPQARGIIRDAVSQFGVEEVITTRRVELITEIRETMAAKMQENGLRLVDFVLRNITFSPEYAASVEQKQIAEQQAQQAAFVVEQRRQEALQAIESAKGQAESVKIRAQADADARIIQAHAEAEALRLIADALQENPDLLTYQYISKLAPGIQVMLVPNDTPYLLPLPSLDTTAPAVVPSAPLEPTPAPTTTP